MAASRSRSRSRPETTARIVTTARELFAERGFPGTTIRAVASGAGVDPALIYHYFTDKRGLLDAVLAPPDVLPEVLGRILADDRDRSTAFLHAVLNTWDTDPTVRGHMVALVRTALSDSESASVLDALITGMAAAVFGDVVADDDRDLRLSLITTQMSGLLIRRYVVVDPRLAAEPVESVAATVAPLLDLIITGPLPGSDRR